MRLFLLGFMGSGKSTVGQQLANELDYVFYDLDSLFEERYETSIPAFFSKYGESEFRKNETIVLKSLESNPNAVISTGGGLPCHSENMDYINEVGVSIYLYLKNMDLSLRLYNSDQSKRPLLKNIESKEGMLKFVQESIQKREPFYFKTHLLVDGSQSVDNIVVDIKTHFEFE